jgi:hypothetical protein
LVRATLVVLGALVGARTSSNAGTTRPRVDRLLAAAQPDDNGSDHRIPVLEADHGLAAMRVVQLIGGPAVAPVAITEHGTPEGKHVRDVERVDGDHDVLHLGRFGVSPSCCAAEEMSRAISTSRLLSPSGAGAVVNRRTKTPSGRRSTSGA